MLVNYCSSVFYYVYSVVSEYDNLKCGSVSFAWLSECKLLVRVQKFYCVWNAWAAADCLWIGCYDEC